MKRVNVRYGVVNYVLREKYEKEYHLPFGYDYMTYSKKEALAYCRSLKGDPMYGNYIVEEIYDTEASVNMREEIFRGG
jgi:hypothetical protein